MDKRGDGVRRIAVFLLVSVVLGADMGSQEYYNLSLEERDLYLQGVIEGIQIVRILAQQHRSDVVFRIDPTLEQLRQGVIMGIEPHMISKLIREIRKQYGYK